jgi:hypothetical protein
MYFDSILNYANEGEACKNASRIPWRWEVPITWFDIMAPYIRDVSWQFNQDGEECKHRLGNAFWVCTITIHGFFDWVF